MNQMTGSDVFLRSLKQNGVEIMFGNLGTDHAGLVESIARHQTAGEPDAIPRLILAMHENVAVSAAHGYTLATNRPQAVIVHVDVGTANAAAGLHNASRSKIPMLVFAGLAPLTWDGATLAGRDESVHFIQEVFDQPSIVRPYVKWEYEVRNASTVPHVVSRAMAISRTSPAGPVYITAAREVLEESLAGAMAGLSPASEGATLPDNPSMQWLLHRLLHAKHPVLLTSYVGVDDATIQTLVRFAEHFVLPVVEVRPDRVNFPVNHPLHQGFQPKALLEAADFILGVGCDVPWVPRAVTPSPSAEIAFLDEDPLQINFPLWPFPVTQTFHATVGATLEALVTLARQSSQSVGGEMYEQRQRAYAARHTELTEQWRREGTLGASLTAANVTATVARVVGEDGIYISETVTNAGSVLPQLPRIRHGQFWTRRGSALGWGLGAAMGVKLAHPSADVVALVGDGSYVFGVPTAAHWAEVAYRAPVLTIIYNNGGWNAVGNSTLRVYPHGVAAQSGNLQHKFPQPPDLSQVVHAVGGMGFRVNQAHELEEVISRALDIVRKGRPAVVDVQIE